MKKYNIPFYVGGGGKPFSAVCIRTSAERPDALDKACFELVGIDTWYGKSNEIGNTYN